MNQKFTESSFVYRLPETIILIIVLILNIGLFAFDSSVTFSDMSSLLGSPLFPAIPIGSIMFYIFFIIDHSYSIIMNRENDNFIVLERMLFFDIYRIKFKMNLSEILSAIIMTNREWGPRGNINITYSASLKTTHYGIVKLSDYSSSNYNQWYSITQKINNFLNSDETYLQIWENPFAFRLISLLPLLICIQIIADSWK